MLAQRYDFSINLQTFFTKKENGEKKQLRTCRMIVVALSLRGQTIILSQELLNSIWKQAGWK
jgi:hypothetical protein